MTGLVIKDFLILRKTLRTYLLFVVVYLALAGSGVWSPEFVSGFVMILTAMLPMNVFSYDKQAKWDTYGLALPVGRTKTVAARYICSLLLCLASVVFVTAAGLVMYAAGRLENPGEYLITGAVCGLIAVLMNAVMLPFLYKFGPDRARVMAMGSMGVIIAAGALILVPLGGAEWLESLGELTPAMVAAIPVIAALAGLVLLAVSFLLSRHFYGQKDV